MWQWELQVLGQELLDVLTLDILGLFKLNNLQDVDRSKSGSVTSGQILVHGLNGTNSGDVSELLVQVVGTRSGVVTDPDTKVLNLGWVGLRDNVDRDNLTRSSLDLVQFLEEVPVTGLGNDNVWSKDSHTEQLWLWNGLSWETTTNNLVLSKTRHCV